MRLTVKFSRLMLKLNSDFLTVLLNFCDWDLGYLLKRFNKIISQVDTIFYTVQPNMEQVHKVFDFGVTATLRNSFLLRHCYSIVITWYVWVAWSLYYYTSTQILTP